MATTSPEYGKNQILKVGATSSPTQITNLTSNGISKGIDTRDVTTKDSDGWREVRTTYKNATIPFEGLYVATDSGGIQNYADLHTLWDDETEVYWELGTGVSGSRKETGRGYITSLDQDAPQDDNVTFSGEITVTGEITVSTYA